MIVYRLEHKDSKLGIWRHKPSGYEKKMKTDNAFMIIDCRCSCASHLSLFEEESFKNIKSRHLMRCACESLASFHFWFRLNWVTLKKYGFSLYEIDVEDDAVVIGKQQVLFDENFIRSRREVSVTEYKSYIEKKKGDIKKCAYF